MKKRNKYLLSLFLCAGVLSFFVISPTKEQHHPIVKKEKIETKTNTVNKEDKPSRSIASLPKIQTRKPTKRVYQGKFNNISQITLINKVSDDWEEKYKSQFFRMLYGHEIKDFKIELKKSVIQVKKNIGRNLEHIVVSYKKPNGTPFSFEAYIDSETGNLVQSWNKTHSELRNPVKIEGSKFRYYED